MVYRRKQFINMMLALPRAARLCQKILIFEGRDEWG
jgi:hypothetical protein